MSTRTFWWFHGKSVADLMYRLQTTRDPRLEVHVDGKRVTFRVVPNDMTGEAAAGEPPPVNDSHVCPPDCP